MNEETKGKTVSEMILPKRSDKVKTKQTNVMTKEGQTDP